MKTHRFFSVFLLLILAVSLLTGPASAAEVPDPAIQAKAALLVDANTGRMVYGKNEHEELYPASLTKIMTALLTLEAVDSGQLSMDQPITVTESALEGLAADGSTAGIRAGEVLTVEQLLECMLIVSANEACNILAEQVSGSVDAFVGAMNEKAAALGCENTHFVNTTGLHDSQHYTSAWDLYLITAEALKHDDFLRICDMKSATIPATNLSEERVLHSTNYLISNWRALGYLDSRAHGVKTGSTSDAGHCLVSTAAEGSLSFISVVLGAESVTLPSGGTQVQSFSETSRLFDWGFENFSYQTVLEEAELVKEVSVALSKVDHVSVHPAADVELLLPKGTDPASLERTLDRRVLWTLRSPRAGAWHSLLSLEGEVLTTVDLLASHDEASGLLLFWRNVRNFFSSTAVKVVGIALLVLAAALIVWKLTVGRRRYRYGRSVPRRRGGGYRAGGGIDKRPTGSIPVAFLQRGTKRSC